MHQCVLLTCIDGPVATHGGGKKTRQSKNCQKQWHHQAQKLQSKCVKKGPPEGTPEHKSVKEKDGFPCQILLGEMMHPCVACRPDVGCTITLLSKFGSSQSKCHCFCPKSVERCLFMTKDWGTQCTRATKNDNEELSKSLPLEAQQLLDR